MAETLRLLPQTSHHGQGEMAAQHLQWQQTAPPPTYDEVYPATSAPPPLPPRAPIDRMEVERPQLEVPRLSSTHSHGRGESLSPTPSPSGSNDDMLQQALSFTNHPVPDFAKAAATLNKPVAIPQISPSLGMPFARGYSDALQEQGITMQEFIDFIDHLNTVSAGAPPLQLLDKAGTIVSAVPEPNCQMIGAGIQAGASLTKKAVSATRQKLYLKESNEKFFAPRGLKVELMKGGELKRYLGLGQKAKLAAPLCESEDMTVHERRVASVAEHTAPLRWDVPEPTLSTNMLDQMNASAQKRQLAKQEAKAAEEREKCAPKSSKKRPWNSGTQETKRMKRLASLDQERIKEVRKKEKEKTKVVNEKSGKESSEIVELELAKVDRQFDRKIEKIDKDIFHVQDGYDDDMKRKDGGFHKHDKTGKEGEKCEWIVIGNLN